MSSKTSSARHGTQHAQVKQKEEKRVPIVDTTLDEAYWYAKFVKDMCLDDANHELVKVRVNSNGWLGRSGYLWGFLCEPSSDVDCV